MEWVGAPRTERLSVIVGQRGADLSSQGNLSRYVTVHRTGFPPFFKIVGHPRQQPSSTVSFAVLCSTLTRAPQGCFRHCGPSASYIATFDPRSRKSDMNKGALFYFAPME